MEKQLISTLELLSEAVILMTVCFAFHFLQLKQKTIPRTQTLMDEIHG